MEFKKVRDSAGTSRRHYKRVCDGCGKIDWVLSTRLKSKCPSCKPKGYQVRTKKSYSKVSKELWTRDDYREKQSKINRRSGEEHHWWNGGKEIPRTFTPEYIEWRTNVFKRDKYTCQSCGQVGGNLNAHHIEHWKNNKEKRFNLNNGQTLCFECHVQVHKGDSDENFICEGKG